MGFIGYLIISAIFGLVIGGFARLALPGPDPMTLLQTMLVGLGGSMIAGLIVWIVTGGRYYGAGWLLSIACSAGIVYIIRRRRGGDLTHPGRI